METKKIMDVFVWVLLLISSVFGVSIVTAVAYSHFELIGIFLLMMLCSLSLFMIFAIFRFWVLE